MNERESPVGYQAKHQVQETAIYGYKAVGANVMSIIRPVNQMKWIGQFCSVVDASIAATLRVITRNYCRQERKGFRQIARNGTNAWTAAD